MTFEESLNRSLSLERAEELRNSISDYLKIEPTIETGFRVHDRSLRNKQRILAYFNASEEDWDNWAWQMKHRICDVEQLHAFCIFPMRSKKN